MFLCPDRGLETTCIAGPERQVYSDSKGRFELDRLPAMDWWLTAYKPGYGTHRQLLKSTDNSPMHVNLVLIPTPRVILKLVVGAAADELPSWFTVRLYNAQGTMVAREEALRLVDNRVRLHSAPVGRWEVRIEGRDLEHGEWLGSLDGVDIPGPTRILTLHKGAFP